MRFKHLLTISLAALAFAGCTNDVDELTPVVPTPDEAAPIAILMDGSIDQQYTTRVDDGGFCDGDQVGLYGVNYTDDNTVAGTLLSSGNQADNALYTYNEKDNVWEAQSSIYYKDVNTNIDIYAYYPYGSPKDVNAYEFEVAADQSGNGVIDGLSQSDFVWGKVEGVVPSEARVRIHFTHRMAAAQVTLNKGNGWADDAEWAAVEKNVMQLNVTRNATIDLATGEVTAVGEATSEGTLMRATADGFRSIVVPQSIDGERPSFAIDIDGIRYRFTQSEIAAYQSGMLHRFNININKKENSSGSSSYELVLAESDIVDWVADLESHNGEARQYYCVHLEQSGELGKKIREAKKNPNKIKNLKVSGKISVGDFRFMRDSMEILQAINLKESEVVARWYYNVSINGGDYHYEWFEGEMPESSSEREKAVRDRYPDVNGWSDYGSYPANVIPGEAFRHKSSLIHFVFPEYITNIGDSAFSNTMLSGALIIPDDVESIGADAFYGTFITSLQLPSKLKSIGGSAFNGCQVLTGTLTLPEGLERIGDWAFSGCSSLTGELVLPAGLKEIPSDCFYCCNNLTGSITIPEGVERIGNDAFGNCYRLNGQLSLPTSLKEIGSWAFSSCSFKGGLVIPENITIIENNTFNSCDFSSIVFPEGLIRIGNGAFSYNHELCEPLVFPKELMTIGGGAFYYCDNIPYVEFPAAVTTIQGDAFASCYGIKEVVSHAKIPPTAMSGAFNGVPKGETGARVRVPAESVVKYQTANEWKEFWYEAYYDFEVDATSLKGDNAAASYTVALTAPQGLTWAVETATLPDWVSVTPASGVGSTALTVTFEALTAGAGDRAGVVALLLDGDKSRLEIAVEQVDLGAMDYTDGSVITNRTATLGDGVNVVFLGEGYDATEVANGKYTGDINEAIEHFFGVEPYTSYEEYFNVYTVIAVSQDSGISTQHHPKKTAFKAKYRDSFGLEIHENSVFDYAAKATGVTKHDLDETLIVLVVNTDEYGGVTYLWEDGTTIAVCPKVSNSYPYDFRGVVQHEACGHGFGKLGDENVRYMSSINDKGAQNKKDKKAIENAHDLGWFVNLSLTGNMSEVAWSHLMVHDDYKNIVDVYEGGYYYSQGVYRSEDVSCMDTHIPYFSAISRQSIVERILTYAGEEFTLSKFYANDKQGATTSAVKANAQMLRASMPTQYSPVMRGTAPELNE